MSESENDKEENGEVEGKEVPSVASRVTEMAFPLQPNPNYTERENGLVQVSTKTSHGRNTTSHLLSLTQTPTYVTHAHSLTHTSVCYGSQGALVLRGQKVVLKPFAEPVDMFDQAILSVSGARDLSRADLFGKSDPFVVLSWACTALNAGKEKEIGLTSAIQQTLDPDWKDEDFVVQVRCRYHSLRHTPRAPFQPQLISLYSLATLSPSTTLNYLQVPFETGDEAYDSAEWASISVRAEVWDMDKDVRGEFLGCCYLSGIELRGLLCRTGPQCLLPQTFELSYHKGDMPISEQRYVKGSLLLTGGKKTDFDQYKKSMAMMDESSIERAMGDGGDQGGQSDSVSESSYSSDSEDGDVANARRLITNYVDTPLDNMSCQFCLDVHGIEGLQRLDTFRGTSSYVLVTWNERPVGRTVVAMNNLNPRWSTLEPERPRRARDREDPPPPSWKVLLSKRPGERLADCLLKIAVYGRAKKSALPDSPRFGYDEKDHFLGLVTMTGVELIQHCCRPPPNPPTEEELAARQALEEVEAGGFQDHFPPEPEESFDGACDDAERLGFFKPTPEHHHTNARAGSVERAGSDSDAFSPPGSAKGRSRKRGSSAGSGNGGDEGSGKGGGSSKRKRSSKGGNGKRPKSAASEPSDDDGPGSPMGSSKGAGRPPSPMGQPLKKQASMLGSFKGLMSSKSAGPPTDKLPLAEDRCVTMPALEPAALTFNPNPNPNPFANPDAPLHVAYRSELPASKQKHVGGTIEFFVEVREMVAAADDEGDAVPAGWKKLRASLLKAVGLPKPDMFGNPSTFYVVRSNGIEVGRSTSQPVPGTVDPVFVDLEAPMTFEILVPLTKSDTKKNWDLSETGPVTLAVDLWSFVKNGKHEFLGGFVVKNEELEALADRGVTRSWHALRGGEKLNDPSSTKGPVHAEDRMAADELKRRSKGAARAKGEARLLIGPDHVTEEGFSGRELELTITAANDLGRADTFGSSDPFCIVYWNDKECGRTQTIMNSLNPRWDDERFVVDVPSSMTLRDCELYIEVFDYNLTTRGVFLGAMVLTGEALEKWVNESAFKKTSFVLGTTQHMALHMQHIAQGMLEMRVRYSDEGDREGDSIVKMEVKVHSARNLAKADTFGLSDPFCIVKFNEREIGRTEVVDNDLNPEWNNERFYAYFDKDVDDMNECVLEVLCYDMDLMGRGDFLGGVTLRGSELAHFFGLPDPAGDPAFGKDPSVEAEHLIAALSHDDDELSHNGEEAHLVGGALQGTTNTFYALGYSATLDRRKQSMVRAILTTCVSVISLHRYDLPHSPTNLHPIYTIPGLETRPQVQGEMELSCREIKVQTGLTKGAVNYEWLPGLNKAAGQPVLEVRVVAAHRLPNLSTMLHRMESYCVVYWGETELFRTFPAEGEEPTWANELVTIPMEGMDEMLDTCLRLELFEKRSGEFLGTLSLSYWSIVCLHDGSFTFSLQQRNSHDNVKGQISIQLKLAYPFWDKAKTHSSDILARRIVVEGAIDLPEINEELPNCKCVIFINGRVKCKSMLASETINPVWAHTEASVNIRQNVPIEVMILVYHVDHIDRKEVCVGRVDLPFEFLLRPSAEIIKSYLGPPDRPMPRKYRCNLSGVVKIRVVDGDKAGTGSTPPWTSRLDRPLMATTVRDVCMYSGGRLGFCDGPELGPVDKMWLGTVTDISHVSELPTRDNWIVMPFNDVSLQVASSVSLSLSLSTTTESEPPQRIPRPSPSP